MTWPIGWLSRFKREAMRSRRCGASMCKELPMLTSDFKESVALFNLNRVEYLVVGGYALADTKTWLMQGRWSGLDSWFWQSLP